MKNIAIILLTLSASPAFGSYLEACEFTATVEETVNAPALDGSVTEPTRLVKLAITTAADRGSHVSTACEERVGESQWLTVASDRVLAVGDSIVIDYFYVNNRGPEGVISNERWTVVDGRLGAIVYSCFQLDRSLPNYTVEIRESTHALFSEQQYNLYVTEDHMLTEGPQTIVAEEDVEVRYLSNQQGGMETFFLGQEATLELQPQETLNGSVVARGLLTVTALGLEKAVQCQVFN